MKAIIEFSFPEDKQDFELANSATKMYCIIWEIDQYLRSEIKYNGKEEFEPIREKLYELMNSSNFSFDMVD